MKKTNNLTQKQWELYFGGDKANGYIRIVEMFKDRNNKGQAFTLNKVKINSYSQFKQFLENSKHDFAYSCTTFNKAPYNKSSFNTMRTILFDVDCYTHSNKPSRVDRVMVKDLDKNLVTLHTKIIVDFIRQKLQDNSVGNIIPKLSAVTGGGLLLGYQIDKFIDSKTADAITQTFRDAIMGDNDDVFVPCPISETKTIFYKMDKSGFDTVHAQRVLGYPRNDYNGFIPYEIDLYNVQYDTKDIANILNNNSWKYLIDGLDEKFTNVSDIIKSEDIEIQYNIAKNKRKVSAKNKEIDGIDRAIADSIFKYKINPFELLDNILTLEKGKGTKRYTTFKDPLRAEKTASVSLMHDENSKTLIINNFFSGEVYGFVSYITHVKRSLFNAEYTSKDAVEHIIRLHNELKTDNKFIKEANETIKNADVELMITKIKDDKRFIYYINASAKQKIYRVDLETGNIIDYDGMQILVATLLKNKFQLADYNNEFLKIFTAKLSKEVVHVCHTKFAPNNPQLFEEHEVTYVNKWIPTKVYRDVMDLLKIDNSKLSLTDGLELIKQQTPNMWIFLNQMAQEGNLKWFTAWLSECSKFRLVSSVPVVFGIFGTGKNVFLDHVLKPFFGAEQVGDFEASRANKDFNVIMSGKNIIALNEGDLNKGSDLYEKIKSITGQETLVIERKGIDAGNEDRHFNVAIFNNHQVPLIHEASDRRITYFRQTTTLGTTLDYLGTNYHEFEENLKKELVDFWAIVRRLVYNPDTIFAGLHDRLYYRQILKMHPVGLLIISLVENDIENISSLLLEGEVSNSEYASKQELFVRMQKNFKDYSSIGMFDLNNYINIVKKFNPIYKNSVGTSTFINMNELKSKGVSLNLHPERGQEIVIDKQKLLESINVENNLDKNFSKDGELLTNHYYSQFENFDEL